MPEQPHEADFEAWHDLPLRAFQALINDRTVLPGRIFTDRTGRVVSLPGEMLPIPYLAISRWAADHGIPGAVFDELRQLVAALDDEWLKHMRQKKGDNG